MENGSVLPHYWPFFNILHPFPRKIAVASTTGSRRAPNTCSLEMFWPQRCERRSRERWDSWEIYGISMGNGDLNQKKMRIFKFFGSIIGTWMGYGIRMGCSLVHMPCEWIAHWTPTLDSEKTKQTYFLGPKKDRKWFKWLNPYFSGILSASNFLDLRTTKILKFIANWRSGARMGADRTTITILFLWYPKPIQTLVKWRFPELKVPPPCQ